MKADLHIHSNYSYDAISKPESILETATEHRIDIIAVTDHDAGSWHEFDRLAHRYPVQVIKGQEIKLYNDRFLLGEVLALFLEKPIKSTSLPDIQKEVKAQGGLISIARPFCGRRGEFRAFDQIDDWSNIVIETKNGRTHKERDNEMARGLAEMLNLPQTAGSDAHTPFEVGTVYLEFDGSSKTDLKRAIQNHDVAIRGEASPVVYSLLSHAARLGIAI
jgi:predicted metal-dependent phosphoesterase TrpH